MTQISHDQILMHMRRLANSAKGPDSIAQNGVINPAINPTENIPVNNDFSSALTKAIGNVNQLQMDASKATNSIETGDGGASLVKAMIASQKAGIAFEAAVQVRNRVVSAYQDIMNMPI